MPRVPRVMPALLTRMSSSAVRALGQLDHVPPVLFLGNVEMGVSYVTAQFPDFRFQLHSLVVQDIAKAHPGAFAGE